MQCVQLVPAHVSASWYCPAGQLLQPTWPTWSWYCPALQPKQPQSTQPSRTNFPVGQSLHVVSRWLLRSWYSPLGQVRHSLVVPGGA